MVVGRLEEGPIPGVSLLGLTAYLNITLSQPVVKPSFNVMRVLRWTPDLCRPPSQCRLSVKFGSNTFLLPLSFESENLPLVIDPHVILEINYPILDLLPFHAHSLYDELACFFVVE